MSERECLRKQLEKEDSEIFEWVQKTYGYAPEEKSLAKAIAYAIKKYLNSVVLEVVDAELQGSPAQKELLATAKTISEHIHKNAKIFNKGDYKKSEEYSQQQVVLLSDVEAFLLKRENELQKLINDFNDELINIEERKRQPNWDKRSLDVEKTTLLWVLKRLCALKQGDKKQ